MSTPTVAFEPADGMSRDEYRAWAARQPNGRFERMSGLVVAKALERIGHNRAKGAPMRHWIAPCAPRCHVRSILAGLRWR
jgi:hypothetical protein